MLKSQAHDKETIQKLGQKEAATTVRTRQAKGRGDVREPWRLGALWEMGHHREGSRRQPEEQRDQGAVRKPCTSAIRSSQEKYLRASASPQLN